MNTRAPETSFVTVADASQKTPPPVDVNEALREYQSGIGRTGQKVDFSSILGESEKSAAGHAAASTVNVGYSEVSSKLGVEGELLASIPSTIGHGIVESAKEAWEHKGRAGFEIVSGLALGAGFCLLSKNPAPVISSITKWAGRAFIGVAAYDLGSRFARPMSDVWQHPEHLAQQKKVLGNNLGDAVFNYSLAVGGGIAGAGLGEKYLATTKLGTFLQGFKETDITAEALAKIAAEPGKDAEPLARMANAFSRRAAASDGVNAGGANGGASGASGAVGGEGQLPFKGTMRLRQMADGSQIGSTSDGSLMVMTKDGTALWFKNNRSMLGLRNKLDLNKVLHAGGDETDFLTGMYHPTTIRNYGKPGPAGKQIMGRDPSAYFDSFAGTETPGKTFSGKSQEFTANDGTRFVTGKDGAISAVETGANRVYMDNKGSWKMTMGAAKPTDLAAHGLANMPLDKISDRLETAKKGAEVGLTEIMLERSGDIGSSVVEHEILIRSGSAAKEGD